jgi:predicted Zn-ribbon and HTH transcriptional regulator
MQQLDTEQQICNTKDRDGVDLFYRTCTKCGHKWFRRNILSEPQSCPKCRCIKWNKPRLAEAHKG